MSKSIQGVQRALHANEEQFTAGKRDLNDYLTRQDDILAAAGVWPPGRGEATQFTAIHADAFPFGYGNAVTEYYDPDAARTAREYNTPGVGE